MAASVILLEAAPLNAATGFAQTVRLAGGGARQPYYYGGQHWRAGIVRLPTFITSISFEGADFGEGGVPQAAELQWAPSTKADLATLAGYFWIDAPVTVHIGPENAAGALPPLRLTGKVLSTSVEDGTLKIQLSDPAAGLKKPLLTDRFGGTGGLDGPTDWDGKIKERVWGRVWNKAGAPIDKANNIYAFADPTRPILAFDTVRDKGAPAASLVTLAWQGTAAATFAALQAAVAPRGGGVVCPSIACVKWWTQPAGDLTTDLRGEIGTGYAEKTADIVQRIVAAGPATPFASGTIAAALTARPAPIGWVANDDSTTVAAMIEELLGNSSLLWVMNAAGEIDIREWAWGQPVAAATSHAVKRTAIFRPVATRKIGYRRNERQMARGDLAAIVLAQDLELADGRTGEALAAQINDIQAIADASAAQIASAADDGTLDRKEKSSILVPRNAALEAFWSYLDAEAAAVGAPVASARSVATTARSAWIVYRDSLSPAWDNDTLDTAVVRDTLVGKLNDYSFALDVLADALRQYAATVAVWDSVSGAGKPADNADVTGDNTAKDTHAVAGVAAASVTSSIAQAAMGIAALFATYGSTENAAASALAAASSASVANQYKQDAATASAASQAARDAAVVAQALATAQAGLADTAKRDAQAATTAAQSAQAAASSSAGLADTAKRDAQAAGTAAAAAKDGAEAAQSAAQGLATSAANYASQASSSASTASTAASTASTQAGVATQAKVDAQAASSAASGAAASASANATIAGQAATSASAYRDAAQTARGGAEAARDQAAVSSDSAAGSASSAASSASVSAIAAATRGLTPNGTFTGGAGGWVTDGVTYGVWYLGKGFRVVPGSRGLVAQDPMVPVDTARTYRLNTKLVLHGSYDQSRQIYVGLSCYDVSGNFLGNVYMPQFRPNPFAGGGVHIESNEYTGTAEIAPFLDYGSFFVTGTVYVQPIALLNYGHEPYNTDINALYLEDITSEKGARDAASAAASSASSAAASNTAAGQAASSANSSANTASTQAGAAAASAGQAATSASNAAGYANSASSSASLSASARDAAIAARDTAISNATASATSAANAAASSTSAGNSATAANQSALDAAAANGSAQAAASNAAGAASSANAAASSAYTYSQQSASYRDQANTQATNAQAYASQASASAASASSSASISAQISGVSSALTVNSKFAAWPDGAALPTAWTAWSYAGGTIVRDNSRQSSGYAALMTASSANQLGMYQRFYLTPGKYFLVATVWMQSGGWNGGGVYVDYQTGINFAVDPDNAGVAGNIGSTIRTWSKPITVTGGYGDVNIYAMTNWDGFGSGMSAKTMQWMECAIVPASAGEVQGLAATGAISTLTASVSTNSSAIASLSAQAANFEQRLTASDATALTQAGVLADHTGKLRSYLSFTAGAGAASAAVKVVATNDNGTTYSGVALEAQEITLSNSQGDNKQVALSLVGGNATFGGDLIVGGGIRFANGLKLKLSVQPVILLASDGQSISYPNAGYIPTATFQTTGLAPIGAGESYNLYLDAQTAGGATVRARIITPGTPSSYNLTADAAGGSGNPTRVVTKGTAGDAVGNQYTVAGNYASTATAYREEVSFYTANFDIVIGIYGRVGGSWVYLTSFADAFDNQYPNGGSKTYNGNFAVTITAPSGVDAFGIAGMAGSGTVNAATAITSVSWTAPGTSASTRSATPNGEKAQLTLVYNG